MVLAKSSPERRAGAASTGSNITLNHRQLGKTDEWLREKARSRGRRAAMMPNRDFFNMWTSGSPTHPLRRESSRLIIKSVQETEYTKSAGKATSPAGTCRKQRSRQRMAEGRFVIGHGHRPKLPAATTFRSWHLQDIETLEMVAAGTYNETNLLAFCEWLCPVVRSLLDASRLIIERRSTRPGADRLSALLMLPAMGIDPFRRLFNQRGAGL